MPISGRPAQGPSLPEKIADLRRRAEEAGRDPASISVTIFGARPDRDAAARMEEAGVDRLLFALPAVEREPAIRLLDRYAELTA